MGDYYAHTLSVFDTKGRFAEDQNLIQIFRAENKSASRALNEDGNTAEELTWTTCYDDLKEFSEEHPGIVLALEVIDGVGDYSLYYFFEGKMQDARARIVMDKFNRKKCQ